MKCLKCGAELKENAKFCHCCGAKVENNDRESKHKEKDKQANKEYSKKTLEENKNQKRYNKEQINSKLKDFWYEQDLFEKIVLVLMILSLFMFIVAILTSRTGAGIIAILQSALFAIVLLMRKNIIKNSKSVIRNVILLISCILVIPYFLLFNYGQVNYEKYNWKDVILKNEIPKPHSKYGIIYANSDDNLNLNVYNINAEEYKEYVAECKEEGFVIDAEDLDDSFKGFNGKGYKVSLLYYETDNEMQITLEAPINLATLNWPESEMARLLPQPQSKLGRIDKDDNTGLLVYIGDTTIEEYHDYVSLCKEKGFNIDVNESEKQFYAKNSDSNKLTVNYEGNNVILIDLSEPEFDIEFQIKCRENLIFSQYDVDMYVDDDYIGSIIHGGEETYNKVLTKGEHKVKFVNVEDDSVTGEIDINILKNETYEFEIHCTSMVINIDTSKGTLVEKDEKTEEKQEKDSEKSEDTTTNDEESEDEILNVSNCQDLADILAVKDEFDPRIEEFADKYSGQKIEFDANVVDVASHNGYNTRFDYLLLGGDYGSKNISGPYFQFEDVNYYDLNLEGENVPDSFTVGLNVHIIATVEEFDSNSGLFKLDPVKITIR